MDDKEITFLIFSASITVLLVSIGLVLFLVFFIYTKNKNMKEQFLLKEQYEKELFAARIEIKDQTLQQVGRELHDNIGQLLTVARIHLKGLVKSPDSDKLNEVNAITAHALDELRKLSKTLVQGGYERDASLKELVSQEMGRIKKTGVINAHLKVYGVEYRLDAEYEIICFRILQEFVSNALKYSGCENLFFELHYLPEYFVFVLEDDGKGFDTDKIKRGSGLNNIENRARMIGASHELRSEYGKGTTVTLQLKPQKDDTV
jgi:two-component system, NarL family, sensor kinase